MRFTHYIAKNLSSECNSYVYEYECPLNYIHLLHFCACTTERNLKSTKTLCEIQTNKQTNKQTKKKKLFLNYKTNFSYNNVHLLKGKKERSVESIYFFEWGKKNNVDIFCFLINSLEIFSNNLS